MTWIEALNLEGVPATVEWRKAENVYYPPNIHNVPTALPLLAALAPTPSEQPPTTQAPPLPPKAFKGYGQVGDQG